MSDRIAAAIPGRVVVTRRALSRVLAAVAAEPLGVAPSRVRVDLADESARLAVRVAAPAATPDGSLRDVGAAVRTAVLADGARITGAEIGSVRVRITGHDDDGRRTR
jgi:hypothetical protein